MALPDVFYFGNAIGDPCDFNRDRVVNMTDRLIARGNQTDSTTRLELIRIADE